MTTGGISQNEYLKTKVMTASPEELQMMLYDGAIRFGEQAIEALKEDRFEDSYNLFMKVEKIVLEMNNSMKDEIAPETCGKMHALYMFCYEKLVTANMKRDSVIAEEALKVLRHMRDTWQLLIEKLKEESGCMKNDEKNPYANQENTGQSVDELVAAGLGSSFSCEG